MSDYEDKYLDYYAVIEQSSPDNSDMKILDTHEDNNGLNYLRFSACLQSFGKRNRNRRLWLDSTMKQMLAAPHVPELLQRGGIPGENGHPVPATGAVTMERILTIDPNNMSHVIKDFTWKGNLLYGTIETLDEGPNSPGNKFMRNIMQGMDPSFSLRSVVPQRKNPDGSIDVTGAGRFVTFDRVILPSHEEAYIDKSVPIKDIITKNNFETVMESFTDYMINNSDKVRMIIDKMGPAMESAAIVNENCVTINTDQGRVFIKPEMKYRKEISSLMRNL
jgi:hypothetical protein